MSCAAAAGLDGNELTTHTAGCPVCKSHAALVDTAVPEPGSQVVELPSVDASLYIKHAELGAGGMGRTYRAFERRLGRVVALKQIRTDTPVEPGVLEAQFDREARLTARLQHPSIVAIYEAGKLGDAPFYAMRLIDGVPLDKEIARRKTLADRLALVPHVLTCAHAIAYAHEQRVVHRDVKPANVVVGKFGEAIVIDWGVACDLDEPAARSGSSVGTPAYMPPEQSKGEAADPSFDIYALGATLYHVLAGQAPYMDLPRITSSSKITPLGQLTPGVPRDLLAIVDKAIARSRDDRYASAKDLADDLSHFLAGRLVAAYEYTRAERLVRWLRRHRVSVTIALLAAVVIAVVSTLSIQRIVAAREVAQARADELVLGRARDLLVTDPTASLAWLAQYPADGPDRGEVALIAAEASSLGVARHVLSGNAREVRDVAVSPDGRRIASAGQDGCAWTWDVTTGRGRALGCGDAPVLGVAYAPDGALIASVAQDGKVSVWDAATGVRRAELAAGHMLRGAAWSADGKRLAAFGDKIYVWTDLAPSPVVLDIGDDVFDVAWHGGSLAAAGRAAKVVVWDASGAARELAGPADGVMRLAFSPDGTRLAGAGRDQQTHVWTLAGGTADAFDDGYLVRSVAWSPDGKQLASAGEGAVIHLRDLATGTMRPLVGHRAAVVDLAFTARGAQLISASVDQTLRVWDVASGTSRVLSGHRDIIDHIAVARDGSFVASASKDHAVRVWPLRAESSRVIAVKGETASDVVLTGDSVATAWSDGAIRIGADVACRSAKPARQLAVRGDTIAWVGHDPEVHACTGGVTRALIAPDSHAEAFAVAFARDGRLVTGGIDKTVRVWEGVGEYVHSPPGGDRLADSRILQTHKGGVWTVAVSPDGARFASGGLDGVLAIGLLDGHVRTRTGHKNHINMVAFSPDGTRVASASDDETARVWSVSGDDVQVLDVGRTVDAVAFSPDGLRLATGAHDGSVRLWDLATGKGRVVARHRAAVKTVAFSASGHYVASGGQDGSVWVVDLEHDAARVYVTLGAIQRVAFAPDGSALAAAGATVQVWHVDEAIAPAETTARVDDQGEVWTP